MTQALALVERLASCTRDERADGHRRPHAGHRGGAHAPPRRQRALTSTARSSSTRAPNVGIAVAAPQGLVVPVIRNAERLAIAEIARARADLVQRARDNKLQQDDLEGGTFTISNLGMFGIEQFVAVLNPPQVAILAVGATEERVVVADGDFDRRAAR